MTNTKKMYKVINPLSAMFYSPQKEKQVRRNVFIKIEYTNKKLSLSGVEAPFYNGNCGGSCGQIYKPLKEYDKPYLKNWWTITKYNKMIAYWKRWHLNDMQPACEHQRANAWHKIKLDPKKPLTQDNMATWKPYEKGNNGLLSKPCPTCGYKYGTKWLFEKVPKDVINFLFSLPETKETPSWV